MLIEQGKENDRLKEMLKEAAHRLESRELKQEQSGTMAEAALALNDVYAAADAAAEQYLENIRRIQETQQQEHDSLIAEAQQEAERIITDAKLQAEQILADAQQSVTEQLTADPDGLEAESD